MLAFYFSEKNKRVCVDFVEPFFSASALCNYSPPLSIQYTIPTYGSVSNLLTARTQPLQILVGKAFYDKVLRKYFLSLYRAAILLGSLLL